MRTHPYHTTSQRTFRQAIVHLLETEYKLVGSHRVIQMIADDIVELRAEYYRAMDRVPPGHVVWRGTRDEGRKPPAGRRAEDEPTVTAVLPLITDEDIAERIRGCPEGKHGRTWARERDIQRVVRLVKTGLDNPGGRLLLSLADLSLLVNRSISTVRSYILEHFEQSGELLPIKGYVLDQGSKPTHKAVILRLYEKGVASPDIARTTSHSLEAVDRYIKDYERVKVLLRNELTPHEISHAVGRGIRTVLQYQEIAYEFHPDLVPDAPEEG
jgi:hypothetical protein